MKNALFALALAACSSNLDAGSPQFTDGGEDKLATSGTHAWRFDDGMPPELFSVLGDWGVSDGRLLQQGQFADSAFPRVLIEDLSVTDFHLSVKCRPLAGSIDQACGLLFRAVDSDNYMLTRANALEDNVRLYRVVDGSRSQFASATKGIDSNTDHTLEVDARGTHIDITWDGAVVISAEDQTFARGAIGVWTKADSITSFDDLVLEVP